MCENGFIESKFFICSNNWSSSTTEDFAVAEGGVSDSWVTDIAYDSVSGTSTVVTFGCCGGITTVTML